MSPRNLWPFVVVLLLSVDVASADDLQPLGINLEGYEYPAAVASLDVAEQGQALKLAYMDYQPRRPHGRAVVLLHGKNFTGAYWHPTARQLAEAGYRVVVPDLIGFGKSSKPDDIQYSLPMMGRHLAQLLDALQIERAAIVGHSMGGMTAARFALMFPNRTAALVLVNPIGLEDWQALGVPGRSVETWYEQELKKTPATIRKYQLESYYDGKWNDAYEPWVLLAAGPTLSPSYPQLARVSAMTYDMIFTQPVCHEFGNIKAPTLLIIGQRDRTALGKDLAPEPLRGQLGNYPELGRKTQAAIPGSQLVELPGVGHLPPIEAFDQFFPPLLKFLDSSQRRDAATAAAASK